MRFGIISIMLAGVCLAATLFDRMAWNAPLLAMGCLFLFTVFLGIGIVSEVVRAIKRDREDKQPQ